MSGGLHLGLLFFYLKVCKVDKTRSACPTRHVCKPMSLLLSLSRDGIISIIPCRSCRLRSSVLFYFLIYRIGWILTISRNTRVVHECRVTTMYHTHRRRESGKGYPTIVPIIPPNYDSFSFFLVFGDNELMMIGDVSMMIGSTVHMKSPTAFPSQSASAPVIPKSIERTYPGREISSGW